ncbi:hypothetical protein LCGC14_0792090 [marine sediment metagenome]|uniref:Uncharacterized protein n=1 Tax=marine sediment metagenome TaxID=412755 RepID=A0A0F9PWL8_9ZZZZ
MSDCFFILQWVFIGFALVLYNEGGFPFIASFITSLVFGGLYIGFSIIEIKSKQRNKK